MKENIQGTSSGHKTYEFEVQLNWIAKQKGILLSDEVPGSIHVATPLVFGGEEKEWTPEHFFLSSISSCFMTTFLVFAKKFKFEISGFQCPVRGQVELVDGKFQFTQIELFPAVCIQNAEWEEKAQLAMEKAKKYCLISNSIKASLNYRTEVHVGKQYLPVFDMNHSLS